MPDMREHIARGLDAMFEAAGDEAIYTQVGSVSGIPVRLMLSRPDEEFSIGKLEARVATIVAEARIAEIPDLAKGDTFTIGDETFRVKGRDRDALRLLWTIDLQ
jgi:predicted lysophospholipase L1 biosynthesis ABC-type transport system permease subunit